ncbi:hypothetical protein G7Z17_g4993 [Cylindrodendrum hubeiense]|uniref:N-acetyltransferase domain-containing protein n=1 Tax=Cylindrodendrum hubeiense TaxID=595255 RepID=A0A9P5HF37_9HYPO|nr:hypothetical protein G7Z17_g4993 [Cylindrodendrum hubeiense]
MSFQMRKAVPADIPALCAVYFSAFADTMVGRQVFPPSSEAARVFWVENLTTELPDPNFEFLVMTNRSDGDSEEQIVGYAKWVRPGTPIEMPPPFDAWPQDGNPTLAVEFFGGLTATHKRMMEDRPHWYLELIGVRKEWMGKGAASPLMRWGVERADEDGLPCFLEATPNGRGMYEKYGFRVVGQQEFESPSGSVLDFFMLRDAKTDYLVVYLEQPSTMCKCEFNRYVCGHESKGKYVNCKTGQPMADSRSSCGVVDFVPVNTTGQYCKVWEGITPRRKETGGSGSGGGSGGGSATSKDALQKNLTLVTSGISKSSSLGM